MTGSAVLRGGNCKLCRKCSSACATEPIRHRNVRFDPLRLMRHTLRASGENGVFESDDVPSSSKTSMDDATMRKKSMDDANICIIEDCDVVKDFDSLNLGEVNDSIQARRSRIFLLMEEMRRLRIQQRLKGGAVTKEAEIASLKYISALPFLPELTDKTLNTYFSFYAFFVGAVIVFGALLAPILEVRLGIGGTTYMEFLESIHMPSQLADVDPIVASFCGGAVGVVSALLVVELNSVTTQRQGRCIYCEGTGYLVCGSCAGSGVVKGTGTVSGCNFCAGSGKVMCTSCLCTGKLMATEHDPRIDPFD
jgi:hypothetical protein